MSLANIKMEQTSHDNWHCEVEVGGMVAKHRAFNVSSFEEAIIMIEEKYREIMPHAPPLRLPQPTVIEEEIAANLLAPEGRRGPGRPPGSVNRPRY